MSSGWNHEGGLHFRDNRVSKISSGNFSAEQMLFSTENFHVKFNGALEIRVQRFLDELFSCGKHILAETFVFNGFR